MLLHKFPHHGGGQVIKSLRNLDTICSSRFVKFTYAVVIMTSIFGTIQLLSGHYTNAFIDLNTALLSFINLKIPKAYHTCSHKINVFILIGVSLLIYLLFVGGTARTGWLWVLMFPPFVFLLDTKKEGVRWVVSFAIILLLLTLLQYFYGVTTYTHTELFILLLVYGLVTYLLYLFKKEVNYYSDQLKSVNAVLEKRVENEIAKNKQKDEILSNQAKQAQMGEMISMIAHQWRQPLNAISAAAINLNLQNRMHITSEEFIQEKSQFIQKKTLEMSEVIDTFMEFVKPEQESKTFFPLKAIHKALSMIGSQLSNHDITIEVNHTKGFETYQLNGVINLLEQIILNLLTNSRDAFNDHPDREEKKITLFGDENGFIIFEDNAGGIPETIQDKVFNPYFTTKEQGKGTGLGLYLSRKIMRNHFSGELSYQSTESGSRFILRFANSLKG